MDEFLEGQERWDYKQFEFLKTEDEKKADKEINKLKQEIDQLEKAQRRQVARSNSRGQARSVSPPRNHDLPSVKKKHADGAPIISQSTNLKNNTGEKFYSRSRENPYNDLNSSRTLNRLQSLRERASSLEEIKKSVELSIERVSPTAYEANSFT